MHDYLLQKKIILLLSNELSQKSSLIDMLLTGMSSYCAAKVKPIISISQENRKNSGNLENLKFPVSRFLYTL